jgi:hypothetical protein
VNLLYPSKQPPGAREGEILMPNLILEIGNDFQVEPHKYVKRDTAFPVNDMVTYSRLWKTGRFVDPERTFNFMHPRQMRDLPKDKAVDVWVVRDCGLGDLLIHRS